LCLGSQIKEFKNRAVVIGIVKVNRALGWALKRRNATGHIKEIKR
jgi:hypothetical protein